MKILARINNMNNLVSFLLSEADEEDTTDPVSNDKEKDKEKDTKDVEADTTDSSADGETPPEETPEETPEEPPEEEPVEGEEPPEEDQEAPVIKSIKTKFDTQEDSEGVRNYFIDAFDTHKKTYTSILGLLKTVSRKYEGVLGAASVISELQTNAKSYLEMVEKFRNDYSVLNMELDQIYKIHKMHISNIANLNTVLRSVCKRADDAVPMKK